MEDQNKVMHALLNQRIATDSLALRPQTLAKLRGHGQRIAIGQLIGLIRSGDLIGIVA